MMNQLVVLSIVTNTHIRIVSFFAINIYSVFEIFNEMNYLKNNCILYYFSLENSAENSIE